MKLVTFAVCVLLANLAGAFELVVAPVGPQNPRNSEAAIVRRKDGSLLLAPDKK